MNDTIEELEIIEERYTLPGYQEALNILIWEQLKEESKED